MAKPVWQQRLQERLDAKPLCIVKGTTIVKHVACLSPSEQKGKMITLRYLTNYNCFNTCAACGVTVR